MFKATILSIDGVDRLAEVPRQSALIVDCGAGLPDQTVIRQFQRLGHTVQTLLVRPTTLAEWCVKPDEPLTVRVMVIPAQPPSVRDALDSACRLARPEITVELELFEEIHLSVLKILSTLGVKTRIPLRSLAADGTTALDAMIDAIVKPGRRAPVGPFQDIRDNLMIDGFEIASLDFRDNDHYVDLRVAGCGATADRWIAPEVSTKRVPFLASSHFCAFCEGLLFCHGYLYAPETAPVCKALFSEMMETIGLVAGKSSDSDGEKGSGSDVASHEDSRCGCRPEEGAC